MPLQSLSQSSKLVHIAFTGLLATQAAIATTAISTFVSISSVLAEEVKTNDQSTTLLFESIQLGTTATDSTQAQAATCWTKAASQNCSYSIRTLPSHHMSQYAPEQLKALPLKDRIGLTRFSS